MACDSVLPYERVACVFIYVLSECPEMWMCVSMCRHVRWMLYVLYSLATLATWQGAVLTMHVLLYMLAAHTSLEPAAVWQKKSEKRWLERRESVCPSIVFQHYTTDASFSKSSIEEYIGIGTQSFNPVAQASCYCCICMHIWLFSYINNWENKLQTSETSYCHG